MNLVHERPRTWTSDRVDAVAAFDLTVPDYDSRFTVVHPDKVVSARSMQISNHRSTSTVDEYSIPSTHGRGLPTFFDIPSQLKL